MYTGEASMLLLVYITILTPVRVALGEHAMESEWVTYLDPCMHVILGTVTSTHSHGSSPSVVWNQVVWQSNTLPVHTISEYYHLG